LGRRKVLASFMKKKKSPKKNIQRGGVLKTATGPRRRKRDNPQQWHAEYVQKKAKVRENTL